MQTIYILNDREEITQTLQPTFFERVRVLNGMDSVTFETDQKLEKFHRLIWKDRFGKWHEYIVAGLDSEHSYDGKTQRYYAESSILELKGDWVSEIQTGATNGTAQYALTQLLRGTEPNETKPRTRWEVGTVENTIIVDTSFYRISVYDALKSLLEKWGLEYTVEIVVTGNKITNRKIHLKVNIGSDIGKRYTWTKDLVTIERNVIREDVITALKGFGKGEEIGDGFGRRINFAEVNSGKDYVTNETARERWGRLNPDGTRSHFFGFVEFDDVTDKNELLKKTREELVRLSQPQVEYIATVEDMTRAGWDHEGVDLGDMVTIIDDDLNVRIKARITQLTEDVEGYVTSVYIGEFRESNAKLIATQQTLINSWKSKVDVWDRIGYVNPDGTINADQVKNLLEKWNEEMNIGNLIGETQTFEGGIRFINNEQSWATEIGVLGLRVADSKLANGEWNWRSFITGEGLGADTVTGKQIVAGSIDTDHLAAGAITTDIIYMESGKTLDETLKNVGRLFTSLPQPPYYEKEQWLQKPLTIADIQDLGWTIADTERWGLSVQELMGGASYVCIRTKETGEFHISDWQLIATGDQAVNALDIKVSTFESVQTAQGLRLTETVDLLTAEGERINSAEKYIGELTARDLQFESQISAVEGRVEDNTTDISNLSAKQLTFDSTIGSHTKDISSLSARALTLEGKVGANEGKIATLTSDALELKTQVGGQATELSNLSSRALTLENGLGTANSNISNLSADALALKKRVDGNVTDISNLSARALTLENGLGTANSNISTLSAKQLTFETRVNTVENSQVTVFRDFPKPPYKANDIWLQPPLTISQLTAKNWTIADTTAMGMSVTDLCGGNSYVCRTTRTTGNLVMSDWQLVSSDGKDAELVAREVTTYKSALDQQALTLNATVTKVDAQGKTLATTETRLTKVEAGMLYVAVKGSDGVLRDTTIRGDDIKTGRISSANGLSYWDLNAGYFSNVSGGREARIAGGEFRIYKGTEEKLFITNRYSARAEDVNISVGNMTRSLFISRSRADKEIDFDFVEFRGAEIDTKFHRPVRFAQAVYFETPYIELGDLIIVKINGKPGFRARNSNVAIVTNRQGSLEQVNVTTGAIIRTIAEGVAT